MIAPLRRELLPCPFCGGEAKIRQHRWSGNPKTAAIYVCCPSCKASSARRTSEDRAAIMWNTRAPSPELAAARKAEREMAAKIAEDFYHPDTLHDSERQACLGVAAVIRALGDE